MSTVRWMVTETPCFPNAWKVQPQSGHGSNGWENFFPSRKEAQAEADRRNREGYPR